MSSLVKSGASYYGNPPLMSLHNTHGMCCPSHPFDTPYHPYDRTQII